MSDETLMVLPVLPTPYQVMLFLLPKGKKGYLLIDHKVFTTEESKPLIKQDSEGLAILDYESTFDFVQKIGFADISHEELDRRLAEVMDRRMAVWRPLEEFKKANMKREILREWKDFED